MSYQGVIKDLARLKPIWLLLLGLAIGLGGGWAAHQQWNRYQLTKIVHHEGRSIGLWTKLAIAESALHAGSRYNIDPRLLLAIVKVESSFKPQAISQRDALGLMQIRLIALKEVGRHPGSAEKARQQLLQNISFNIEAGARYFDWLLKRYGGNIVKALLAYNRGPTVVRLNGRVPIIVGDNYVYKVLRAYVDYSAI